MTTDENLRDARLALQEQATRMRLTVDELLALLADGEQPAPAPESTSDCITFAEYYPHWVGTTPTTPRRGSPRPGSHRRVAAAADVDLGEDPEPLGGQRGADALVGLLLGRIDPDGIVSLVAHDVSTGEDLSVDPTRRRAAGPTAPGRGRLALVVTATVRHSRDDRGADGGWATDS